MRSAAGEQTTSGHVGTFWGQGISRKEESGMSDLPRTRYVKSGEVHIAYQVVGDGAIDVLWVPGLVSHFEYGWEHPRPPRFFRRVASFARLLRFDIHGTGVSDRVRVAPV